MRAIAIPAILILAPIGGCACGDNATLAAGHMSDDELAAYVRSLDEQAPPWTGECPEAFLDRSLRRGGADEERLELISHAVWNAADRGDHAAVRCAVQEAREGVEIGLERGYAPAAVEGAARRLYRYAYFGELLGVGLAADGALACDVLDDAARRDVRGAVAVTVGNALEDGALDPALLASTDEGVAGGDYCGASTPSRASASP
jgi:hypothetical protein